MTDRMFYIKGTHGELFCKITDVDSIDDGRPVIFVVPGGPGLSHEFYEAHSGQFRRDAHLVFFDHFGTGKSARSEDEAHYCLKTHVKDMDVIRKALSHTLSKTAFAKVAMLGTSYGGMCSLQYAVDYPSNLSGLILVSTTHTKDSLVRAQHTLNTIGTSEQKRLGAKLFSGTFQNNEEVMDYYNAFRTLYFKKRIPDVVTEAYCEFAPLNYAFGTKFQSFNLKPEQLRSIACPTAILTAEHDWICDTSYANEILVHIPDCAYFYFPGSGHGLACDDPQRYNRHVNDFIKKHLAPQHSNESQANFDNLKFSEWPVEFDFSTSRENVVGYKS